jgi:hypothetical protein
LSKLEAGRLGEKIVLEHLHSQGFKDAKPMNAKQNNYPIDMVQDHGAIEVKTGLVSNGKGAQQWRATIGQPGKKESAWLAKASAADKRAWNEQKSQDIIDRKNAATKALGKEFGGKFKGSTMTTIINPDTKTVDLYFHSRIGWHSPQAKGGYVGSYQYR